MKGKKLLRKWLTEMLAVIMILTSVPISVHAVASGDDYPYKGLTSGTDDWNFFKGQCTSFVAWCLNSRNGINFTNQYMGQSRWGHAKDWGTVARNVGITVDMNPTVGSVWWTNSGDYGHVAWVKAVNGNDVTIEEYNYYTNPYGYHTRTLAKNSATGYIHFKDIPQEVRGSRMEYGAAQTIPNGDYHIVSALDPQKCLDIAGGSSKDGANLQIASSVGQENQVFTVTYGRDGFYKIIRKSSGKSLDVSNGDTLRETNVQQWTYVSNSDAQQWCIKATSDGMYTLQARCSGFFLDVQGGVANEYQNVWQWDGNGTNGQKWRFIPYGKSVGQTIPNGEYQIVYQKDPSKTLGPQGTPVTSQSNIELNSHVGDEHYTFDVQYESDGYYSITHHDSGLSLDVNNAGWINGTNLKLYKKYGSSAQKWLIKSNGKGGYNIISKDNALYVDLYNGSVSNGTNIHMWMGNGTDAQSWLFVPWDSTARITTPPVASQITYGQTLRDSTLSGGTANVPGRFVWKDMNISPSCADSGKTAYQAVFYPSDAARWKSTEISVTVKVNPSSVTPNLPGNVMTTAYKNKTVGSVALPADWIWLQADKNKTLTEGKTVKATAIYNGTDKGNYKTERVEISLTRSSCSHPKDRQEIRGAVAATSSKDGYTGDTYCLDCQKIWDKGSVIPAFHDDSDVSTHPTNPGQNTGGNTNPSNPGQNGGGSTSPTNPGQNTGSSTNPSNPGQNTGGSTNPTNPGDHTDSANTNQGFGWNVGADASNPSVTVIKYNTLLLHWDAIPDAKTYEVYCSTSADFSNARRIARIKKTTYKFTKANCGQTYYFQIKAYQKSGKEMICKAVSPIVEGKTYLTGNLIISKKVAYNNVTLKWKKINGAKRYEIYRALGDGEYQLIASIKKTQFKDNSIQTGRDYHYYVKAVSDRNMDEKESNQVSAYPKLSKSPKLKIKASDSGLRLSWSKVPGADYYEIYRLNQQNGSYEKIHTVNAPTVFYIDTAPGNAASFTYKIQAWASFSMTESKPVSQSIKQ